MYNDNHDNLMEDNFEMMERETEFFSFHPYTFVDDISESTHDYCADSADFIESCLNGHPLFSNQEYKDEIKQGTNKVWEILDDCFTRNLQVYEEFLLENIFRLPEDLILPFEQLTKTSNINNNTQNYKSNILDKELEDLRNQITKINNDNIELKKKTAHINSEIKVLKAIEKSLGDTNNFENQIVPCLESINTHRKELDIAYQSFKSEHMDSFSSLNNIVSNDQNLLDKMTSLKLDSNTKETDIQSTDRHTKKIQQVVNKL
ncbi:hypothetical protein DLAC_00124 [Tieghemostelium lacteum]|uniref:Uncharacterized protein n=1 Tax=Tieghemostelium lacteum TaxID=361077 RepID=A0A152A8W8_TIELA|nr:hypothetical protein DLAC_00124 [Tieghemostelium lacteum]|eukprot:KYR02669.1 hypothetical protein DLAC_00124 [Tieghemostelium lacteum]